MKPRLLQMPLFKISFVIAITCVPLVVSAADDETSLCPASVRYLVRSGDTLSELLEVLGNSPLYGKRGMIRRFLNSPQPGVSMNGNVLQVGRYIRLPVGACPSGTEWQIIDGDLTHKQIYDSDSQSDEQSSDVQPTDPQPNDVEPSGEQLGNEQLDDEHKTDSVPLDSEAALPPAAVETAGDEEAPEGTPPIEAGSDDITRATEDGLNEIEQKEIMLLQPAPLESGDFVIRSQ